MKKNVREYKNVGVQFAYVLDCIYNDEKDNMSDKEAINYFFDCFNEEYNYNYNKRLYPNLQKRISEYIQGFPNCLSIAFIITVILLCFNVFILIKGALVIV